MSEQIGLFTDSSENQAPLAFRSRPNQLAAFQGQPQIRQKLNTLDLENLPHIVFFGPPGCGKTTLANILAKSANYKLYSFNAVLGGVNDLRKLISEALSAKETAGEKSIIFIDEIHRFNKAQQDALLPYLEQGDFVLLGATTENPNTSLNQAILSRVQKWRLIALNESDITKLLHNVLETEKKEIDEQYIHYISTHANGDARYALNQLELLLQNHQDLSDLNFEKGVKKYFSDNRRFDRNSDRHYDVISAFIKSVRGSDVDAAILWLAVMLDGGEDIEFIARRLIILASEDIGNADPRALTIATDAHYAIKQIGMPEARIILSQATSYLARAPKSNASYLAINEALEYVRSNPTVEVPTHLRNHHPNKKDYKYPHSYPHHWTEQVYQDTGKSFFESSGLGYEKMQDDYLNKIKS